MAKICSSCGAVECEPCNGLGFKVPFTLDTETGVSSDSSCRACSGKGWLPGGEPGDDENILCPRCNLFLCAVCGVPGIGREVMAAGSGWRTVSFRTEEGSRIDGICSDPACLGEATLRGWSVHPERS